MAQCTAPIRGHQSPSAAENCPACRGRSRGYGSYYSTPSYHSSSVGTSSGVGGTRGSNSATRSRAKWSPSGSNVTYTPAQIKTLTPIRANVEIRAQRPELKDVFLCHAWADRKESAKELHDLLEQKGVKVWFSEKDIPLGSLFMREIDKGLANSRIGLVLVTPSFLERVANEGGVAEKELSALLAQDLLVPIVHNTTFDKLRDVSPLLGSKNGLDTSEDNLEGVASKIAELVDVTAA